MRATENAHAAYLEAQAEFAVAHEGEPSFLSALRAAGMASFADQGFPSRRREEWRDTNLSKITREPFVRVDGGLTAQVRLDGALGGLGGNDVAFVDGGYREDLSRTAVVPGLSVESLAMARNLEPEWLDGRLGAQVDVKVHPFAALNTAFLDDGAICKLDPGAQVSDPIRFRFAASAEVDRGISHPRVLIEAEAGSRACIVLDFTTLGSAVHLTNCVIEVRVGENAHLQLVTLQRESDAAMHFCTAGVEVARDAHFASHVVTLGGDMVRMDLEVLLAESGADCTMNGLFVASANQHIDHHTRIDHAVPRGTSRQLYKGVLDGKAKGVFRGRVLVRPDAQKTDASQSSPNLLLSRGAEVDAKPQLEIYADDVKCSHGSTIGQLEEDALFYLRTRGLDEDTARDLLTRGFAAEIIDSLPVSELRGPLERQLLARLGEGREGRSGS
ncbi:Fe-S cluster assembly protein SufD [Myxococcota bacterium]|nr:Fe-S cluster assembly protein SufD [Myxococcota bacterium]